MVNFLEPKLVSGVVTQGSPDSPQWVEQYYVYMSLDRTHFQPYTQFGGENTPYLFTGNTDGSTPVRNLFKRDIVAQYVKIVPVKASSHGIGLRFTVLGCNPSPPPQGVPTPSPPPSVSYSMATPGVGMSVPTLPTEIRK